MTQTEKEYRSTTNRIGGALSFFLLLFSVLGVILGLINNSIGTDTIQGYVTYQIAYGAVYMFSFMFPVLFYKKISKKHALPKMKLEPAFPKHFYLWVFASLAVVLAASYINSQIVSLFTSDSGTTYYAYESYTNYEIVLNYIIIALVPPFCEEFFFRGMILENLRPYGKTTAIIGSAAAFAIMHQNVTQTFYTFCAGIALGIVYEKSNSVWPGIIIHIFNNQFANTESELYSLFNSKFASYVTVIIEAVILIAGLISIFVLVTYESREKKKSIQESGAIGMTLDDVGVPEVKLTSKQLVKGFFTPWMIVFTVLGGLSVVLTLLALI